MAVLTAIPTISCVGTQCSGVGVGDDTVITAKHCVPDVMTVPGRLPRERVSVGDTLRIAGYGCVVAQAEWRTGNVVYISERYAYIDTHVCPGDSGSPAFDTKGNVVGIVVKMVVENGRLTRGPAIVELF